MAMDYLSAAWTAIYYVAYPIFRLLGLILYVLSTITAPLVHLGLHFLYVGWYVFHIISNIEALYIFFGIAALVGIVTGTSLHYVSGFIMSTLNLDNSSRKQRVRILGSDRVEKLKRRGAKKPLTNVLQDNESLHRNDLMLGENYMDWIKSKRDRGRGADRFNTILEEEDSSEGF